MQHIHVMIQVEAGGMRGGGGGTGFNFNVFKVAGKPRLAVPLAEGRSHCASLHSTYRSPGRYQWRSCRAPEQRGSSEARLANRKGSEAMAGSARDLVEVGTLLEQWQWHGPMGVREGPAPGPRILRGATLSVCAGTTC